MREETVKLQDDEIAARINKRTGEISPLERACKMIEGREVYNNPALYRKTYQDVDDYLYKKLSLIEYSVIVVMSRMAEFGTNSLDPLDDSYSAYYLETFFEIDRKKVKKILLNLYNLGVYGKFSVAEIDEPYKKYWILNPYVSYKGNVIQSDIIKLFEKTEIAKYHFECLAKRGTVNRRYKKRKSISR